MYQPKVWGLPRYVTLIVVLALHVALLAALVTASRTRTVSLSTNQPVELLFFLPANVPKIRSENSRPKRSNGDTAISIAPPALDSTSPSLSPAATASDGNGSGIDWAAESRRALQAFEIRNHQPPASNSLSGSPAEDSWWPQARRHAGNPFKTASGDWIVWINASCYQVASSAANAYALGVMPPQTFCPGESGARRGDVIDQVPAYKKRRPKE
jgi:hypothetical protein